MKGWILETRWMSRLLGLLGLYVKKSDIVDNLNTTDPNKAAAAPTVKLLNDKITPYTSESSCSGITNVSHTGSINNVQVNCSVAYVSCVIVTDASINQGNSVFTVPYNTRLNSQYVMARKDDGTTIMLQIVGNEVKTPLDNIAMNTVLRCSFVYFIETQ